ncbi:hypothetical protein HGRIS_004132 [Hohenbuehelia grisea]|uniref:C2H2-type domain-containing protein n=1 Tax=Hohenbuehelia grisea TaxID=104357 RepID=A0ABR3JHP0_9AGAR
MLDYNLPAAHFIMLDHYLPKQSPLQVIQLVECPAPPPRPIADVAARSDATSSSYDDDSNYYSSSTSSTDPDDDDEDCSSYCSSDLPSEEVDDCVVEDTQRCALAAESLPQTESMRMKRILAWREDFSSQMSDTLYDPSLSSPLKRKIALDDGDDDVASQSSKRSRRSQASDSQGDSRSSASSLCEHACPACDAMFETRHQLRQHGRDAASNEACCVAVDYAFE